MNQAKSGKKQQLEQLENIFDELKDRLMRRKWFKEGKWIAKHHRFPGISPEGVTFHLFKEHWFNDDTQGIHFESYLSAKKPESTYVTAHILHHDKIPGTNLKRTTISKPFIDEIAELVEEWPGYRFRTGKYGVQPFALAFTATREAMIDRLLVEHERLSLELGNRLDRAILKLGLDF